LIGMLEYLFRDSVRRSKTSCSQIRSQLRVWYRSSDCLGNVEFNNAGIVWGALAPLLNTAMDRVPSTSRAPESRSDQDPMPGPFGVGSGRCSDFRYFTFWIVGPGLTLYFPRFTYRASTIKISGTTNIQSIR
jgi:hypothetical protein